MRSQIPRYSYFFSNLRAYASTTHYFLAVNHNYERSVAVYSYRPYTLPEILPFEALKDFRGKRCAIMHASKSYNLIFIVHVCPPTR